MGWCTKESERVGGGVREEERGERCRGLVKRERVREGGREREREEERERKRERNRGVAGW